jgi:dienelactone hydrolase
MMRAMMSRRPIRWILGALIVLGAAALVMQPYVTSAAFILDLSGSTSWIRRILPVRLHAVTTRDFEIPTRHGQVAVRLYTPDASSRPPVIVMPGIHAGGVNEPRLDAFARRLATTGTTVLSLPLPDLRVFHVTPRSTDVIEDAALWMTAEKALAPSGRIGLVGVSFAGGLSLVAAGRPSLRDKVQVVVALGGHSDLPRTMTYLCTGRLPDGSIRPPHDYGVVIILMGMIDRLVQAEQVEPLRRAVLKFLEASSLDASSPGTTTHLFDEARALAAALPEPSHGLMQLVIARDAAALGPKLIPYIEAAGGAPALSPDRSPATPARVFLLHGADDNIIPSTETPLNATYLRGQGNTNVQWLLTPLLSHANVNTNVPIGDAWRLIVFWKELLGTAAANR